MVNVWKVHEGSIVLEAAGVPRESKASLSIVRWFGRPIHSTLHVYPKANAFARERERNIADEVN